MASPSPAPPIIPVTQSQAAQAAAAPVQTSAFRAFLARLAESSRRSLAQARPWSELLDRSAFSRPDSLSEAASRARKNLAYFRLNYAIFISAALALSLLTNPAALLALLVLLAAWCLLYLFRPADSPLLLFGRTFSDRETLGGLVLLTVVVVFLTSVGSVIVSALLAGAAIVAAHAALRVPEDLFLDDQEQGGAATGFLSFLGGGGSSAAAGPAVAVRV